MKFGMPGAAVSSKAAIQLSTAFDGSTLKVFLHRTEYLFRRDEEADWSRFLTDLEKSLQAYYSAGLSTPRTAVGFISLP